MIFRIFLYLGITIFTTSLLATTFFVPSPLSASTSDAVKQLEEVAGQTNVPTGGEAKIYQIIGAVINIILGLLGLVVLIIIIYSGFEWMTAGGNTDKIDTAKKRILTAVIGLAIILGAAVLTNFILDIILSAVD